MNVFNRIMVTLLCLAVIALGVLLLVAPVVTPDTIAYNLQLLSDALTGRLRGLWIAVTGLVMALGVLVLVLEFIPRQHKTIRIWAQGRGDARLRVTSVAQTLEYRIDQLDGVRKVVPRLVSHGKDLTVKLEVDSSPSANIPALSDQIIDHAIRILEGELGLKVRGKVELDITHEPFVAPPVPVEAEAPPAVRPPRPQKPEVEPVVAPPPPPPPEPIAEEELEKWVTEAVEPEVPEKEPEEPDVEKERAWEELAASAEGVAPPAEDLDLEAVASTTADVSDTVDTGDETGPDETEADKDTNVSKSDQDDETALDTRW